MIRLVVGGLSILSGLVIHDICNIAEFINKDIPKVINELDERIKKLEK